MSLPTFDRARLREARKAAKVRREEIAADLGVTYKTIYRWESDQHHEVPSLTQAARIAEMCRVDLRELVTS